VDVVAATVVDGFAVVAAVDGTDDAAFVVATLVGATVALACGTDGPVSAVIGASLSAQA
jgi:hypothetical protein